MNGWSSKNYVLNDAVGVSVAISQTDFPVTTVFPITAGGSRYMTVALYVSGVAATATAKLQSGVDPGSSTPFWETARTAVLSNGWNVIRLNNEASNTQIPLMTGGRVVVDTNGTGTVLVGKSTSDTRVVSNNSGQRCR